jgi:hypothetical protein
MLKYIWVTQCWAEFLENIKVEIQYPKHLS